MERPNKTALVPGQWHQGSWGDDDNRTNSGFGTYCKDISESIPFPCPFEMNIFPLSGSISLIECVSKRKPLSSLLVLTLSSR